MASLPANVLAKPEGLQPWPTTAFDLPMNTGESMMSNGVHPNLSIFMKPVLLLHHHAAVDYRTKWSNFVDNDGFRMRDGFPTLFMVDEVDIDNTSSWLMVFKMVYIEVCGQN